MTLYLLDTDHISLAQRRQPQVSKRILKTPVDQLCVSVVTVEEQLRGRLAQVNEARKPEALTVAYRRLREAVFFYHNLRVVDFEPAAITIFEQLRQQKIRIGTLDLRIAATALSLNATVVTRNQRDFDKVPHLQTVDWSH